MQEWAVRILNVPFKPFAKHKCHGFFKKDLKKKILKKSYGIG